MTSVLALGLTQIIGYGSLYYAFAILVPGVAASFGRPEAHLYAVFSVGLLVGGLAAPVAGRLMDRFGAPRLMTAGSGLAAACLVLIAMAPTFPVWAAGVILTEIVAVAVLYDAAFAALAQLRGASARRAITRLTLIAGFASTIFWPLTAYLDGAIGWRATYLFFAALHLTLGLGLHVWLARQTPVADPVRPADLPPPLAEVTPLPPEEAARAFRAVAFSFALSGALISAFGVHMVPVLAASGLAEGATAVAMLVGPAQVGIRLVDALFFTRLHPLTVAAVSASALPLSAAGLVLGLPVWAAGILFAGLFGVGQGLASIVRGTVPLTLFGRAGYGARLGRLAMLRTVASAGAPFAFAALGAAVGWTGALWLFAGLGVAATLPLLALRARLAGRGHLAPLR
jgi:MFS family permease